VPRAIGVRCSRLCLRFLFAVVRLFEKYIAHQWTQRGNLPQDVTPKKSGDLLS
jgi:hypothetical protein